MYTICPGVVQLMICSVNIALSTDSETGPYRLLQVLLHEGGRGCVRKSSTYMRIKVLSLPFIPCNLFVIKQ